jgi:hypothetical protein
MLDSARFFLALLIMRDSDEELMEKLGFTLISGAGRQARDDVIANQFPYCQRLGLLSCRVGLRALMRPREATVSRSLGPGSA